MEVQYKVINKTPNLLSSIKYIIKINTVLCQPGPNVAHYENQRAKEGLCYISYKT